MLAIQSLGSSSKGNAFLVTAGDRRYLVDAGHSCRYLETALLDAGCPPGELDALIITHSHSDHIRGLPRFIRQHRKPVYLSRSCATAPQLSEIDRTLLRLIRAGEQETTGSTRIRFEAASHDANETCWVEFTVQGVSAALIYDTGIVTTQMEHAVERASLVALESNYDPQMLAAGPYPPRLQRRIAGDRGHLSNSTAAELLERAATSRLQGILLCHLSETNNRPLLAGETAGAALRRAGRTGCRLMAARPRSSSPPLLFPGRTT